MYIHAYTNLILREPRPLQMRLARLIVCFEEWKSCWKIWKSFVATISQVPTGHLSCQAMALIGNVNQAIGVVRLKPDWRLRT